jgi:hypothetical protein
MVTVDPDGGLWFGTSGDGVFYIKNPGTTAPFTITSQYSGSTGSWKNTAQWNNIYSLDFAGKTLYAGSSAGLAYNTFEFANGVPEESPPLLTSVKLSADKKTVTLTFDKTLDQVDATVLKGAISLKKSGETSYTELNELDQAEISGNTLSIKLNTALQGTGNKVQVQANVVKSGTAVADSNVEAYIQPAEGCFIATAAFGSYLDPHVWALRQFRDNVLLKSAWGRWFVKTYYHYSPPIANVIASSPILRMIVRLLLTPIILTVEYPMFASIILIGILIAGLFTVRRRKRTVVSVTEI